MNSPADSQGWAFSSLHGGVLVAALPVLDQYEHLRFQSDFLGGIGARAGKINKIKLKIPALSQETSQ